jgi:ankyrin repeat protein
VDEAGCTALWCCAASRLDRADVMQYAGLLLDHGADPHGGISLLHAHFHFDLLTKGVRWLIQHGADPNRCDHYGQTALHKPPLLDT